jgi:hypothetical protein
MEQPGGLYLVCPKEQKEAKGQNHTQDKKLITLIYKEGPHAHHGSEKQQKKEGPYPRGNAFPQKILYNIRTPDTVGGSKCVKEE